MIVQDLIKQLRKLPADTPVMFYSWAGTLHAAPDAATLDIYYDRTYRALVVIPNDAGPRDPFIPGDLVPITDFDKEQTE